MEPILKLIEESKKDYGGVFERFFILFEGISQNIVENDDKIVSLETSIAEKDGKIATLAASLDKSNGLVSALENRLAELEGKIGDIPDPDPCKEVDFPTKAVKARLKTLKLIP